MCVVCTLEAVSGRVLPARRALDKSEGVANCVGHVSQNPMQV
jgi:hypothetical protein